MNQASQQSPQVGIVHLMLATACIALMFGWMQNLPNPFFVDMLANPRLFQAIWATIDGFSLAGLIWIFWFRRKSKPRLAHPGYFAFVGEAIIILQAKLALAIPLLFDDYRLQGDPTGGPVMPEIDFIRLYTFIYSIGLIVAVIFFMWSSARLFLRSRIWSLLFLVLAIDHLMSGVRYMLFDLAYSSYADFFDWIGMITLGAIATVGMIAIGIDLFRRQWRDGMHWIGILWLIHMCWGARLLFWLLFDPDNLS